MSLNNISGLVVAVSAIFFNAHAENVNIMDGLYYSYWVYGESNNYKITSDMANKPLKIGSDYYFKNNKNTISNDEIYMKVKKNTITFFYKHDEIEGGPSIGWSKATPSASGLLVKTSMVKNFYDITNGFTDGNAKYKVGNEFTDGDIKINISEIIPLEEVNPGEYKVNCFDYFKINSREKGVSALKNNPMRDYSGSVFINYNGICNIVFDKNKPDYIRGGWVLLKKIG
ncbi:hypothetical protein C9426_33970 [Serratia sp. S1B]|nr:hypothetical protein C9426_33970 [Serratia sp. S1B]